MVLDVDCVCDFPEGVITLSLNEHLQIQRVSITYEELIFFNIGRLYSIPGNCSYSLSMYQVSQEKTLTRL